MTRLVDIKDTKKRLLGMIKMQKSILRAKATTMQKSSVFASVQVWSLRLVVLIDRDFVR